MNRAFIILIAILFYSLPNVFSQDVLRYVHEVVKSFDPTFSPDKNNLYGMNGIHKEGKEIDSVLRGRKIKDIVRIDFYRPNELPQLPFYQKPDHWFIVIDLKKPQSRKEIKNNLEKVKARFKDGVDSAQVPIVYLNDTIIGNFEIAKNTVLTWNKNKISSIYYFRQTKNGSCIMKDDRDRDFVKIWTKRSGD